MLKTICVIGATGGQGGSVAKLFAKEPGWKVRGITRRPHSAAAQALVGLGIEVVAGDLDDQPSLERAFHGCQVIFAVTDYYDYFFDVGAKAAIEREFTQGCNIAQAAANTTSLEQLAWSTLPDTELLTQGKAVVPHFQGKGRVNTFIQNELPQLFPKVTFLLFGIFNINLITYENCKPIYLVCHTPTGRLRHRVLTHTSQRSTNGFRPMPPHRKPPTHALQIIKSILGYSSEISSETHPDRARISDAMLRI